MKKLLTLSLAIVLVFSLCISVFADEPETPPVTSTIKVVDAHPGETYNLYKIFDAVHVGDDSALNEAPHDSLLSNEYSIVYTIKKDSLWKSVVEAFKIDGKQVFEFVDIPTDTTSLEVVVKTDKVNDGEKYVDVPRYKTQANAAAFAEYLGKNIPGEATCVSQVAGEGDLVFDVTELGYYFLTTTTGSLFALDTNNAKVNIKEKNEYPHVDKVIDEEEGPTDKNSASIGDTVTFEVTVTDGTGTDKEITLIDTMSAGLTFKELVSVKDKNGNIIDGDNYTFTKISDQEFTLVIDADYVKTLDKNDKIVIVYKATINANAVIFDSSNTNEIELKYSAYSETSNTDTYVYGFDIVKVKSDNTFLTGAEFKLYDAAAAGNEIELVEADGVYRPKLEGETAVSIAVDANGVARVQGLKAGKYYLEETKAPDGYNRMTGRQEIVITNNNLFFNNNEGEDTAKWEVATEGGIGIVNLAGSELPSTGGIGTTIFYVVGSICVLGALVMLVSKKKMAALSE